MPKNQFIQAIEGLLEDEIYTMDFKKINWKYAANEKRTDEIFAILDLYRKQQKLKLVLLLHINFYQNCKIYTVNILESVYVSILQLKRVLHSV